MHQILQCIKGRVGDFGKASDNKLALKTRSPPSLHNHSAKPRLLQNTRMRSGRPETNLRYDEMQYAFVEGSMQRCQITSCLIHRSENITVKRILQ